MGPWKKANLKEAKRRPRAVSTVSLQVLGNSNQEGSTSTQDTVDVCVCVSVMREA